MRYGRGSILPPLLPRLRRRVIEQSIMDSLYSEQYSQSKMCRVGVSGYLP